MHVNKLCEPSKRDSREIYAIFICVLVFHLNVRRNKKFMRYKFMRPSLDSHNSHQTCKKNVALRLLTLAAWTWTLCMQRLLLHVYISS